MTQTTVETKQIGTFKLSTQTNQKAHGDLLKKLGEKRVRLTSQINSGIPLTMVRKIACKVNQGKHKGAVKFCAIGSDTEWMIYVEPKNGTDALQYLISEMHDIIEVSIHN